MTGPSRRSGVAELAADYVWALQRAARILGAVRIDSVRRAVTLGLAVPGLLLLSLWHGLGFLLDELVAPRYRTTPIHDPVFVIGMPRSGTTFLQEVLASDEERFATIRLRELLFTPAISQRRIWASIARVDTAIGRPAERLGRWLERRATRGLDDVHPIDLDAPEEDFLFFLPMWACFALVALIPESRELWSLTRLDDWPKSERDRIVRWYRRSVQRQLYWDRRSRPGQPPRVLLSKNPSFTGLALTLREAFPDAVFVCCYREVSRALASQLSSMAPSMELFGRDPAAPEVRERFEAMYRGYGDSILQLREADRERVRIIPLRTLSADVKATVLTLYDEFGWTPSDRYVDRLDALASRSRNYRSSHRYTADDFGLVPEEVDGRFEALVSALDRHALAPNAA